jgi:hypothetical protein
VGAGTARAPTRRAAIVADPNRRELDIYRASVRVSAPT